MQEFTNIPLESLIDVADTLISDFQQTVKDGSCVVTLSGNLGAGKTTFVQQCAQVLGVAEAITSPTYVLMKAYKAQHAHYDTMVHIDAYRLKPEEIYDLDWDFLLVQPRTIIFVEWPEKIQEHIPKDAHQISLRYVSETLRDITVDERPL